MIGRKSKLVLLVSLLTLFGCGYFPDIAAKAQFNSILNNPVKPRREERFKILPSQPSSGELAIPLTYKLETYTSVAISGMGNWLIVGWMGRR